MGISYAKLFFIVRGFCGPEGEQICISNSDDAVWTSVQEAFANAGLETETVHILDKGQPSIKGVKGLTGKENVTSLDLLLCLKKRNNVQMVVPFPPPTTLIDDSVLSALAGTNLRTDKVYSAVLRAAMAAQYSVFGITMPTIVRGAEH